MSIHSRLRCLRSWLKPAPSPRKPRKSRFRLGLETLEERLALSTLSFDGRVLVYEAGANVANNLTISRTGSTYTFAETAEPIQLGNTLNSTVNVDRSLFDSIKVVLKDRADVL